MTRSFFQAVPPDVAIEIDCARVAVARLSWRGTAPVIGAQAVEPLPPRAVIASLSNPNISDVALVGRAVTQALGRLGGRVTKAALVIPDTATKVSLVRFEQVPADPKDLTELVRWQVRKSAPFPIEQAVVGFTPGAKPAEGGQEFVVTIARADTIQQYEEACSRAGVHAGLVDIATFSIINGVLAAPSAPTGDWLLVHATTTYSSVAVLRGTDLIFYRNHEEESEGSLADLVHQISMYYEDRLKGTGFSRVLLAGSAIHGGDAVRRSLEQRLDVRIEPVPQPELASLIGILGREQKVA